MIAPLGHAPTGGLRRWYAVLGGIGWWMFHLVVAAALVREACIHPALVWGLHADTLVAALGTAIALFWCTRMVAVAPTRSSEPGDANWERFLALFGIALNAISLLLILWEGSYVIALNACTVA